MSHANIRRQAFRRPAFALVSIEMGYYKIELAQFTKKRVSIIIIIFGCCRSDFSYAHSKNHNNKNARVKKGSV